MTEEQRLVRKLADFEWASVGRYIQYVSVNANLMDINLASVHSFRIVDGNIKYLVTQKRALCWRLEENLRRLVTWVGAHADSLEVQEKEVLRSVYRDIGSALASTKEHLAVAERLLRDQEEMSDLFGEGGQDDLPF